MYHGKNTLFYNLNTKLGKYLNMKNLNCEKKGNFDLSYTSKYSTDFKNNSF